jgi:hypothetical protein
VHSHDLRDAAGRRLGLDQPTFMSRIALFPSLRNYERAWLTRDVMPSTP